MRRGPTTLLRRYSCATVFDCINKLSTVSFLLFCLFAFADNVLSIQQSPHPPGPCLPHAVAATSCGLHPPSSPSHSPSCRIRGIPSCTLHFHEPSCTQQPRSPSTPAQLPSASGMLSMRSGIWRVLANEKFRLVTLR